MGLGLDPLRKEFGFCTLDGMLEIGDSVRDARLRQGLEYAQVEAALRIRSRYLAALEEERFDVLPGQAYAKSFLREYAEFLGLDSARLLDEFKARFEQEEEEEYLPVPVPHPGPRWQPRRPRLAGAEAFILLVLAVLLVLGLTAHSNPPKPAAPVGSSPPAPSSVSVAPAPRPPSSRPTPRPLTRVSLRARGAWDPDGDGREHDAEAPLATDGNDSTYWRTETYENGLLKPGVGLLLDAARNVRLRRLVLMTDTPGFTALIEAGPAPDGPFRPISSARTVTTSSAFVLHAAGERYYVVWITKLEHRAHVNEVRALGR